MATRKNVLNRNFNIKLPIRPEELKAYGKTIKSFDIPMGIVFMGRIYGATYPDYLFLRTFDNIISLSHESRVWTCPKLDLCPTIENYVPVEIVGKAYEVHTYDGECGEIDNKSDEFELICRPELTEVKKI